MSCVLKCDLCGRMEFEVKIREYVDEPIKDTLLKGWNLSKPVEHICLSCIDRINDNFEYHVLEPTIVNARLTRYGKESNK